MSKLRKATDEDVAKYLDLNEQLTNLIETVKDIQKKAFQAGCTKLFEENPGLEEFGWRQYTPGFNDGDPCVFRVDIDYCFINDLNQDGETLDGEWLTDPEKRAKAAGKKKSQWIGWAEGTEDEWKKLFIAVQKHIMKYRDDDMQAIFGNDVRVTITRKNIKVEGYDCGY